MIKMKFILINAIFAVCSYGHEEGWYVFDTPVEIGLTRGLSTKSDFFLDNDFDNSRVDFGTKIKLHNFQQDNDPHDDQVRIRAQVIDFQDDEYDFSPLKNAWITVEKKGPGLGIVFLRPSTESEKISSAEKLFLHEKNDYYRTNQNSDDTFLTQLHQDYHSIKTKEALEDWIEKHSGPTFGSRIGHKRVGFPDIFKRNNSPAPNETNHLNSALNSPSLMHTNEQIDTSELSANSQMSSHENSASQNRSGKIEWDDFVKQMKDAYESGDTSKLENLKTRTPDGFSNMNDLGEPFTKYGGGLSKWDNMIADAKNNSNEKQTSACDSNLPLILGISIPLAFIIIAAIIIGLVIYYRRKNAALAENTPPTPSQHLKQMV